MSTDAFLRQVLLAAWLLPSAGAADLGAPPEEAAYALLASSLGPLELSYAGELVVESSAPRGPGDTPRGDASPLGTRSYPKGRREWRTAARRGERLLRVRVAPGGRYRRELLDRHGFPLRLIVSDGSEEWVYDPRRRVAWRGAPADPDLKLLDPDEELELIAANYALARGGPDRVAGLPCERLELRARAGGRLVQGLCVERRGLVLSRVGYGPGGEASSRMRFTRVELPAAEEPGAFRFAPPAGTRVVDGQRAPEALELAEAEAAAGMVPRPPAWLPPGFVFESVSLLPHAGLTVLHFRYTDGIEALSLFQAPREARLRLAPEQADAAGSVAIGPRRARLSLAAEGSCLDWSAGERFILLGRLAAATLRRVAASVPEPGGSHE